MQIPPIGAASAIERYTAAQEQLKARAGNPQAPANTPDPKPKEFTPAPGLRPNVQDYVDINRTLMALRGVVKS